LQVFLTKVEREFSVLVFLNIGIGLLFI